MSASPSEPHPSFLALDSYALGGANPTVERHLQGCEACAAHVGRVQQPVAIPAWVRERSAAKPVSRWAFWTRFSFPRVAGLAAVAAVALFVTTRVATTDRAPLADEAEGPAAVTGYVGAKGGPIVDLIVRRGETVESWSPEMRLKSGDAFRVRVGGAGYAHVTVASRQDGRWQPLHEGPVTAEPDVLPGAWTLDGAQDEHLLVVLSRAPLPSGALQSLAQTPRQDEEVWSRHIVLAKERP